MLLTFVFNFAIISYKLNLNCRKGGERGNKMTKKEIMQAVEGLRKNQSGRIAPTAEIAALARAETGRTPPHGFSSPARRD